VVSFGVLASLDWLAVWPELAVSVPPESLAVESLVAELPVPPLVVGLLAAVLVSPELPVSFSALVAEPLLSPVV
jgi:hypothetical protein